MNDDKIKLIWLHKPLFVALSIVLTALLLLVTWIAVQGTYTDRPALQTLPPTNVDVGEMQTQATLLTATSAAQLRPDDCAKYYDLSFGGFQPDGDVLMLLAISPAAGSAHITGFNISWSHYAAGRNDIYLSEVGVSNSGDSPFSPSYLSLWRSTHGPTTGPMADTESSSSWVKDTHPLLEPNTVANIWISFSDSPDRLSSYGAKIEDFAATQFSLDNGCWVSLSPVLIPTATLWVPPLVATLPADAP